MAGITALLADSSDWCVLGEAQTISTGAQVTKIWMCNFSGSSKTFTIDLPHAAAINRSVGAGSRGYAILGTDISSSEDLFYRLGGWSGSNWELRLYSGDQLVGTGCFSAV